MQETKYYQHSLRDSRNDDTLTYEELCPYCGGKNELYRMGESFLFGSMPNLYFSCRCDGWKRVHEERLRADEEERKREYEESIVQALVDAGVPRRFTTAPQMDNLYMRMLDEDGKVSDHGLYLLGNVGTGKTTTAAGIMRSAVVNGIDTMFVSVPVMFQEIRSSYGDSSATEKSVMANWLDCKLLVLDDLGKGELKAWALERLFMIVDGRYGSMLPTIYTSQYDFAHIAARLAKNGDADTAEAIMSRIWQTTETVNFTGGDRRM